MTGARWAVGAAIGFVLGVVVTTAGRAAEASAPGERRMALVAEDVPQIRFAAGEIRRACATRNRPLAEAGFGSERPGGAGVRIFIACERGARDALMRELGIGPMQLERAQSYAIRRVEKGSVVNVAVLGADSVGAMYGGLDVAEAIRLDTLGLLRDADHAPHIAERGIKFNIPLDVRTPSYSDNSDAAQKNIGEMWSIEFWREFLDEMARHRYNVLTLWSLHPFPSLVRVPEFPEVALNDVLRTTLPLDDTFSHSGNDMVRPAMLQQVEVVRNLSIDQKIQFWRDVMQLARDRGIDVYWFTWNMFVFGAEGKHGITRAQTDETTIAYFRASVREMVLTYPLLAGFGITAGERMEDRKDAYAKEKWLWRTYGEGVRDALKQQPGRKVRMIHRFHMTGQDEILREWKDYPGPLDLSFKYAIAHMYSTPKPPFLEPALPHLSPNLRTWLTVRNDDIYSFRWGDPAYARAFISAIPGPEKIAGFYMGPDGYIWGRDFLSKEASTPRELVIQKQWYSFMLWGRLSYDPSLPDDLFKRTLGQRFPQVSSDELFATWASASRVFPQITRFFWGDIDLRWLPEACISHPRHKGWYTVRHFVEGHTMPGSALLNILDWREQALAKRPFTGRPPSEVADALERDAAETLRGVAALRQGGGESRELRQTLGDLEAFGHLGHYYAEKIRGACALALYDALEQPELRDRAVGHLEKALGHWRSYADCYTRQYVQPVLYNRVGVVDIPKLAEKAAADVEMARQWKPGAYRDLRPARPGEDVPFRK